jgi:hypothetical protein
MVRENKKAQPRDGAAEAQRKTMLPPAAIAAPAPRRERDALARGFRSHSDQAWLRPTTWEPDPYRYWSSVLRCVLTKWPTAASSSVPGLL